MFGNISAIVVICIGIWGIVVIVKQLSLTQQESNKSMRCPSCGAAVRIYGNTWECTECRDFGKYDKKQ